jgi:holo-[acyl-carrier protein] synthase
VIALGTDLVRISRLERHGSALGDAFLRRVYTPAEVELCAGDVASLAGRWAAKEAVLKALGVGIGEIPLTDVEVGRRPSGQPDLTLHAAAADAAAARGITRWSLSISHDGDYATATAIGTAG